MINAANVIGLNPKDWQNSAEEARVVAESMQDEQSKQLMLCIAKEYERAAELTRERPNRVAREIVWSLRGFLHRTCSRHRPLWCGYIN
jgi:hypothetical protein